MREVLGIDVYHRTGTIDWASLRAAEVEFAIIKASEGGSTSDSRMTENATGAQRAGLLVSYYHYGRPDLGDSDPRTDARHEAEFFLKCLAGGPAPDRLSFQSGAAADVWLDLEKAVDRWDRKQTADWVDEFLSVVEAQHLVGFYTKRRWLADEVAAKDGFKWLHTRADGSMRPIWVARYGANDGDVPDRAKFPPDHKVPAPWSTYDVWQYTSNGKLPGTAGRALDLSLGRLA